MYQVGDHVVYPMHGAGVIEAITEKEIMGQVQQYYTLKMPIGNMSVMIPVLGVEEVGVRDVISAKEADAVLNEFRKSGMDENNNWNKRYRENMAKIKSGSATEVAHVVKSLMLRDHMKGLSTGERKMLSSAKQILLSEISLAKKVDHTELEAQLEEIVSEELAVKE